MIIPLRALIPLALLLGVNAQVRRGVNIAGAEFGNQNVPGTLGRDYTFNSESTFRYFGEKKLGLMRVPVLWERLQPVLRGPLDAAYLANLKRNVAWARAHGGEIIVDIQNFGRYNGNIIDNPSADGTVKVSAADLADLWVKLSNEFKFEPGVYAYGLMNEPHDMARANWKTISRTVLNAIRANQDDKLVLVPGDSWSSANRWAATHGASGWIEDPSNNFAYEAHQYFDRDESGTYVLSYDAELAQNAGLATIGATRVAHFIDWCRGNNVRGIVDEYGIPDSDTRWAGVLDGLLSAIDAAGMDGAYWAAGEWWGNYALSVQPASNFTVDRPQMKTLEAHAPGGYLAAYSAASLSVQRATAGSLVTLYGTGFASATAQAGAGPYPLNLAGTAVEIADASGAVAQAGLLFVSPTQINLRVPAGMLAGRARIVVRAAGAQVAAGSIEIAAVAPSIFTANTGGAGVAAAQVVRVKADGTATYEAVVRYDNALGAFVAAPIAFGDAGDRLFLLLYGTGIAGSGAASAKIGAVDVAVAYAGPQNQYDGLDQANLELPRTLAGAGEVNVKLTAGGAAANAVTIAFQ